MHPQALKILRRCRYARGKFLHNGLTHAQTGVVGARGAGGHGGKRARTRSGVVGVRGVGATTTGGGVT